MFWRAVYDNGEELHERSSEFQDIEKDRLRYFLLEDGESTTIRHDTRTGQVEVNENRLLLGLDGKLLGRSSDVINFKEKCDILDSPTAAGPTRSGIVAYYTGWKENNESFKYIEPLLWVDVVNQELKIRMRVTPADQTHATLHLILNGKIQDLDLEFKAANKKEQFVIKL